MKIAIAPLILSLILFGCSKQVAPVEESSAPESWGTTVAGVRCRLFMKQKDNATAKPTASSMSGVSRLMFEIDNQGVKPVVIPVFSVMTNTPVLELMIPEVPDMMSPPSLDELTPSRRELAPGASLTCNIGLVYSVGYGKATEGQWIRFKPEDKHYRILAKIRIGTVELTSNAVEVKLN